MIHHEIRKASTADASALSTLIQDAVRVSNSRDYNQAIIELICANFALDRVIEKMEQRDVFVAASDCVVVGTVSLGQGKLHSLFVAPEHQGGGIGRRSVEYLERHAVGKGLSELWLSSSITAKPFYTKLGYELVHFEERPDGSTFLMKKPLL
ncbi:GNAT family N-acetyltransferase [Bradyrhizobium sp. 180]|uniref:GNAT family N-acetyltransferase n=1 Tax=unclassified Bradyrhizobium TaxID=2631580 RepID=UPI001FFBC691|nr:MULTISPECIES: GNAT family N-acetyltransferase [unclassified Bradyrhizobium]MCK1423756.1 GNAT family N-acetyltransferase [Bradyrhizobium sp. CW12]MCK1495250.1 GNAT family N-acetyltransferase [Bradyrhizobium sp. 180]MCK1526283.1 GNAT family N-acetyltransferase [Bradyrhizobium sp. 182]MCK1597408.1 GNAT family N-acetyltransferase [Bradyrhizobium sp. 164]MCK1643589.1 GNAT family N-acetyltransferase [Bradyrhizobium sp. 154]